MYRVHRRQRFSREELDRLRVIDLELRVLGRRLAARELYELHAERLRILHGRAA